jgi:protein TonB
MLDAAAIDAVRQWRYEPTFLNGTPVPVILPVSVFVGP